MKLPHGADVHVTVASVTEPSRLQQWPTAARAARIDPRRRPSQVIHFTDRGRQLYDGCRDCEQLELLQ